MRDQFVLSIDRLLTAQTIDICRKNSANYKPTKQDSDVMCRICHDEDEDRNLESPCSCCGSLKYAHRKCVQKWCDEKGDTLCEICLQPFKPGYTAPSKLLHYGGVPMNFSWEMSQRDANHMDEDDDDYSIPTTSGRSVLYCRSVAVIFVILLVLRHTLPIMIGGQENYSSDQFAIVILRITGILLPMYAMFRLLMFFHLRGRRQRQESRRHFHSAVMFEDEERNENTTNLQWQ